VPNGDEIKSDEWDVVLPMEGGHHA
jgi:hypothetical protein